MPRARRVTGLLVLVGLLTGLAAALVWHFAAPPGSGPLAASAWGGPRRPSWSPSLPLLSALGMLVGWFVAACANAEGWRIVRVPSAGHGALVALVGGTAVVAGVCFAWAWTEAPPSAPAGGAMEVVLTEAAPEDAPQLGAEFCGDPGMLCVFAPDEQAGAEPSAPDVADAAAADRSPGSIRVGVGSPWLAFPILCALVAAVSVVPVLGTGARVVRWTAGRR